MNRSDEAAAILLHTFEALSRQVGKTLSAKTRTDLARACELLAAGDDYEELLDDLPAARVMVQLDRDDWETRQWNEFRIWQQQKADEECYTRPGASWGARDICECPWRS
jgi:hypothetical protein